MNCRLSADEFVAVVDQVVAELPEPFRGYLANVAIDIEQRPDRRTLRHMGFAPGEWYELMGLFQGVPLTDQEFGVRHPNKVTLFKQSIEWASRSREEVAYEIRRTLLHELAHHFGYSEEALEEFESIPSPFDADSSDEDDESEPNDETDSRGAGGL